MYGGFFFGFLQCFGRTNIFFDRLRFCTEGSDRSAVYGGLRDEIDRRGEAKRGLERRGRYDEVGRAGVGRWNDGRGPRHRAYEESA